MYGLIKLYLKHILTLVNLISYLELNQDVMIIALLLIQMVNYMMLPITMVIIL